MGERFVTAQLQGDRDCVEAFRTLRQFVRGDLFRRAVRAGAELLRQAIVERIPVGSPETGDRHPGRLRDNIAIRVRRTAATIRARITVNAKGKANDPGNAFYWKFLEFGHMVKRRDGSTNEIRRPFVAPAFEAAQSEAAQQVIDAFEHGLDLAERRARKAGAA